VAQINSAKNNLLARFRGMVADHEQLLRLALNEAEALAWESHYPELVFQDLAEEKAQTVVNWVARQQSLAPRGRFDA